MSLATLAQAIAVGLLDGAFYAFLALSFTLVLGLTRALNLAHGDLVLLGGYLGYSAGRALGWHPVVLAPLAGLLLVPVGLVWRALLHRLREPVELSSLVLTFGLSLLLQNGMLALWSADYRLIAADPAGPVALGIAPARIRAAAVGISAIALLQLLLTRTRWGAAIRATGRDPETAQLMGVNTDRVGIATFAVAAALAGVGGVLFAGFHYLHPAAGIDLTLLSITLAILGGIGGGGIGGGGIGGGGVGRLPGLLAGGLGIGLAGSLTITVAGPRWRELVVAGFLLGVLVTRGGGLGAPRGAR